MREIALHLLDIAENSVAAESQNISIEVHEDLYKDLLAASVTDDGRGMDAETAQQCAGSVLHHPNDPQSWSWNSALEAGRGTGGGKLQPASRNLAKGPGSKRSFVTATLTGCRSGICPPLF